MGIVFRLNRMLARWLADVFAAISGRSGDRLGSVDSRLHRLLGRARGLPLQPVAFQPVLVLFVLQATLAPGAALDAYKTEDLKNADATGDSLTMDASRFQFIVGRVRACGDDAVHSDLRLC